MFSCYPTATGTLSQTLARPLAGKHGTKKKAQHINTAVLTV
jgi:hypothetical protein